MRLETLGQCTRAERIAAYLSSRGEIDLGLFLKRADEGRTTTLSARCARPRDEIPALDSRH